MNSFIPTKKQFFQHPKKSAIMIYWMSRTPHMDFVTVDTKDRIYTVSSKVPPQWIIAESLPM